MEEYDDWGNPVQQELFKGLLRIVHDCSGYVIG